MRAIALALTLLLPAAVAAGPLGLDFSVQFTFTDCASGGSASQNVTGGTVYLVTVTDSDVFLCYAGTCAAGGMKLPSGSAYTLTVPGVTTQTTTMSCRSAASTGDINLVRTASY